MGENQKIKLALEPAESQRFKNLRGKLDAAESRLRSLQGRAASRQAVAIPDPSGLEQQIAELEAELMNLLRQDLSPPSGPALRELEEKLRQQALAYFQKSRVDPQLWKDLASS